MEIKSWGKVEDYPTLNLEVLKTDGRICVRCNNEHESQWFLAAMKVQFPDKCDNWSFPHGSWSRSMESMYMYPHVRENGMDRRMLWGSNAQFAINSHYKIVDFNDLVIATDIGEFSASEMDLSLLLA